MSVLPPPATTSSSLPNSVVDQHQVRDGFCLRLSRICQAVVHHVRRHTGVGIVCAVAYFDPGNWGVDLKAGSEYGYRLLFVVLLAGIFAVFVQVLASRLGCVTGLDLASHCRLLLHSRPRHTLWYRWGLLYPLYILAEIAIIATDLAELLGSAVALCLLFPTLPLWAGVLITAADVLVLLVMGDPLRGRPVKMFEAVIAGLVLAVLVCMAIIIARIDVDWGEAFDGFIPSKYIFKSGALYTSVGIIGATVMPHSLFLGSALATQDRVSSHSLPTKLPSSSTSSTLGVSTTLSSPHTITSSSTSTLPFCFSSRPMGPLPLSRRITRLMHMTTAIIIMPFRTPAESEYATRATRHADRENRPYEFVRAHVYHGIVDVVTSLLCFAVLINSFILILASAVFFYNPARASSDTPASPASLFDAYDLIRDLVGQSAATLFAIALLAAGQSSSIIATVAGQAVSEGFIQWRMSPALRRILTRLIAIIPSMVVALAVGRQGINALLIASQVILSIVLPFIVIPLVWLTSSREVMSVKKWRPPTPDDANPAEQPAEVEVKTEVVENKVEVETATEATADPAAAIVEASDAVSNLTPEWKTVDFSSGKMVTCIGVSICLVVIVANVYCIVSLAIETST